MTEFLDTSQGRRIAYVKTPGSGPGVVFLGGFKSDMEGSKALHLEQWAKSRGQAYLRFDYSGHGKSSERFEDGCIGDWALDAETALLKLTDGPQILVGSSMGGWISSLYARAHPKRVVGFVGVAVAPDFTEDGFWAGFTDLERSQLQVEGYVDVPSDYGEPYRITRRLIEDGRNHFVMRTPLVMPFPVRLMQGTEDNAVSRETALRFFDHIQSLDARLTFAQGADHSFSSPLCLEMLTQTLDSLIG